MNKNVILKIVGAIILILSSCCTIYSTNSYQSNTYSETTLDKAVKPILSNNLVGDMLSKNMNLTPLLKKYFVKGSQDMFIGTETDKIFTYPDWKPDHEYKATSREWYIKAKKLQKPFSSSFSDVFTGGTIATTIYPIFYNSRFIGALGVDIKEAKKKY